MNVPSSTQLKQMNVKQLAQLCEDIRAELISTVPQTGGHLASNLGAVELTVALHYVFDKEDKIVFDVGHQSYVHKLLSGGDLSTLRQEGGLSAFCDPEDGIGDRFVSGHASTALSSALGLATARDLRGETYNVVAVVGDGALTGGLSYEALNNVNGKKLLVVLNDNGMSISGSTGALSRRISRMRVGKYDRRKTKFKNFLTRTPLGRPLYKFLRWSKNTAKRLLLKNNYFENFDMKYAGVIDGNDVGELVSYLTKIKNNVNKPTVLHIATKKGKGYAPAEEDPEAFHNIYVEEQRGVSCSEIVGQTLTELAEKHDIAAVSAAMTGSVGLKDFAERFPERTFDVGIAEEHAVTFAGGLAVGGVKPYVLIYSTFLQRAYDQILHDVAIAGLPVTFLLDRSGFVGGDGQTHQGLQDLSYLTNIPHMTVWTPCGAGQLREMIRASASFPSPLAIRYPKRLCENDLSFVAGHWNVLTEGKVRLLAVGGNLVENCRKAAEKLPEKAVEIVAVTSVKPLDEKYLSKVAAGDVVVTLEENQLSGGFGCAVDAFLKNKGCTLENLAVDDRFVRHAETERQFAQNGLDSVAIENLVKKYL